MGHINAKAEYLALQKRLDKNPIGAPPNKELFGILEELFTEEECAIAASIPLKLATAKTIAYRAGKDPKRVEEVLSVLSQKGLVVDIPHPSGKIYYFLNPTVIGFFEFTMMRVRKSIDQKKVAKLLWDYFHNDPDQAFIRMITLGDTFLARPLVNETALEPQVYSEILDWEKASEIVENGGVYSEGLCHCRHVKAHLGERCDKPENFCLGFGTGAEYLIRNNLAKQIDKGRAKDVLVQARELGLVQMGDNVKNKPMFICNCCSCCCEMLHGFRTFIDEIKLISSNYVAVIEEDACNGCGKCSKACPVEIIGLYPAKPTEKAKKRKKMAKLDADKCLGCGVCFSQCEFDALKIKPLPARVYTPQTLMEKTMVQALERGKLQYILFDNPDKVSHRVMSSFLGSILKLSPAKQLLASQQVKSKFIQKLLNGFSKTKQGWMADL